MEAREGNIQQLVHVVTARHEAMTRGRHHARPCRRIAMRAIDCATKSKSEMSFHKAGRGVGETIGERRGEERRGEKRRGEERRGEKRKEIGSVLQRADAGTATDEIVSGCPEARAGKRRPLMAKEVRKKKSTWCR